MSRIIQGKLNSPIKFIKAAENVDDHQSKNMSRNEALLADEISESYTKIVSKKHVELVDVDDCDEVMVLETPSDVCIIDTEPKQPKTNLIEEITVLPNDDISVIEHNPKEIECLSLVDDDDIEEIFNKKNVSSISPLHTNTNFNVKKKFDIEKSYCEIVSVNQNTSALNSKKKTGSYFDVKKSTNSLLGSPSACFDYCHVCSSHFTINSGHELTTYHQIKLREVILNNNNILTASKPPCKAKTVASTSPSTSANCSIPPSNIGFKMLVAAGWKEDSGLGKNGNGIKTPIITKVRKGRSGLGLSHIKSKQFKPYTAVKPITFQLANRMNIF